MGVIRDVKFANHRRGKLFATSPLASGRARSNMCVRVQCEIKEEMVPVLIDLTRMSLHTSGVCIDKHVFAECEGETGSQWEENLYRILSQSLCEIVADVRQDEGYYTTLASKLVSVRFLNGTSPLRPQDPLHVLCEETA